MLKIPAVIASGAKQSRAAVSDPWIASPAARNDDGTMWACRPTSAQCAAIRRENAFLGLACPRRDEFALVSTAVQQVAGIVG